MIYFDTTYLVRLYLLDQGWEKVRKLAAGAQIGCSLHGKAELVSTFHRKFREGSFTQSQTLAIIREFEADSDLGAFTWLPISTQIVSRVLTVYSTLPKTIYLRAADALHLSSAAENQFKEIYSNDTQFLNAAGHFGLTGINIL